MPSGEEAYGRSCLALHERLGLGERFRFMGPTGDPDGAVRDADVVLMTSISEGLPMSILEAMGQARPVVVDGRRRRARRRARAAARSCAPGDDHGLAMAVVLLLRNPELACAARAARAPPAERIYNESACVDGYRDLLQAVAEPVAAPPARIGLAA